MVKHTQKIRRQQPTNFLSVFDHFVGVAPKGLTEKISNGGLEVANSLSFNYTKFKRALSIIT